MGLRGVRPFSPRARALPMLLSETEILAVGTRSTAGTVLVTASTLACRREVLPTKARYDGPGRGAREALKKPRIGIRGPAGRRPTPPRDDLARHFQERSISRSAVFTDVKAPLNFAGREQALVSP